MNNGLGSPVVLFAHNNLRALARPGLPVISVGLLVAMLDAKTRAGSSTPKADPSGEYDIVVFAGAQPEAWRLAMLVD